MSSDNIQSNAKSNKNARKKKNRHDKIVAMEKELDQLREFRDHASKELLQLQDRASKMAFTEKDCEELLEKNKQLLEENNELSTLKKFDFMGSLSELAKINVEKNPAKVVDLIEKNFSSSSEDEMNVYTPESLFKAAQNYLNTQPIDTHQMCEKLWMSYYCGIKLFYQRIGIWLESHRAVTALSKFAFNCFPKKKIYLEATYFAANCAHKFHYTECNMSDLYYCLKEVKLFLNYYKNMDDQKVKQELDIYIKDGKLDTGLWYYHGLNEKCGDLMIEKEAAFSKYIFGKRFTFTLFAY